MPAQEEETPMTPRTLLAAVGATVMLVAALAAPAATAAPVRSVVPSVVPGPHLGLIAVQQVVTIPKIGNQPVLVDPDTWVASYGSGFRLDVQRANYTAPVTVKQIITTPHGAEERRLPVSVVANDWNGLNGFLHFTLSNARGKVVISRQITFCPGENSERAIPASAASDPYPAECGSFDPFPLGEVWGLPQGWAADPFESLSGGLGPLNLAIGKYRATVSIAPQYRTLFGVSAGSATATVGIDVVNESVADRTAGPAQSGTARPAGAALPTMRTMTHPPRAALPQLTALPAWGISTSSQTGHDLLDFGATVWVGGDAPLDVEGFHVAGSSLMAAYQYFWRDGKVIGQARVGTMGYYPQPGYENWHFQQFAQYQLLGANKKLVVRSHKLGFCIAPTDGIDMLIPGSTWLPPLVGLAGQCGTPGALWVQEYLPVGWGDTYDQSKPGQAFDITSLPNGVYYIEIIANPQHKLYELSAVGNISLRKVILGGTKGHRTVRVPAWNRIDPEG
jgi:hypothetical protein